jgi:hypothetical protein
MPNASFIFQVRLYVWNETTGDPARTVAKNPAEKQLTG